MASKKVVKRKTIKKDVVPETKESKLSKLDTALLREERRNYKTADKVKFSNNMGKYGIYHLGKHSYLCYASEFYMFIKKFPNRIKKKEGVYDIESKERLSPFSSYSHDKTIIDPKNIKAKFKYELTKEILADTDHFVKYNRDDLTKAPLAYICFDFTHKKVYPTFGDELVYSLSKQHVFIPPKFLKTVNNILPDADTVLFNETFNCVIFKKENRLVLVAGCVNEGE